MAYHANKELFANVIEAAVLDIEFRNMLLENPSEILNNVGLCIPENTRLEFDEIARSEFSPLLVEADERLEANAPLSLKNLPSFSCAACTVSVWTVAALITAVGAAGVAALTITSGPVIALASFAGVSTTMALAFIQSLGVAIAGGVANVAKAICKWINACP